MEQKQQLSQKIFAAISCPSVGTRRGNVCMFDQKYVAQWHVQPPKTMCYISPRVIFGPATAAGNENKKKKHSHNYIWVKVWLISHLFILIHLFIFCVFIFCYSP